MVGKVQVDFKDSQSLAYARGEDRYKDNTTKADYRGKL